MASADSIKPQLAALNEAFREVEGVFGALGAALPKQPSITDIDRVLGRVFELLERFIVGSATISLVQGWRTKGIPLNEAAQVYREKPQGGRFSQIEWLIEGLLRNGVRLLNPPGSSMSSIIKVAVANSIVPLIGYLARTPLETLRAQYLHEAAGIAAQLDSVRVLQTLDQLGVFSDPTYVERTREYLMDSAVRGNSRAFSILRQRVSGSMPAFVKAVAGRRNWRIILETLHERAAEDIVQFFVALLPTPSDYADWAVPELFRLERYAWATAFFAKANQKSVFISVEAARYANPGNVAELVKFSPIKTFAAEGKQHLIDTILLAIAKRVDPLLFDSYLDLSSIPRNSLGDGIFLQLAVEKHWYMVNHLFTLKGVFQPELTAELALVAAEYNNQAWFEDHVTRWDPSLKDVSTLARVLHEKLLQDPELPPAALRTVSSMAKWLDTYVAKKAAAAKRPRNRGLASMADLAAALDESVAQRRLQLPSSQ